MGLNFRHYKTRTDRRYWRLGWVLYDRRRPTLDVLVGNHVFKVFWSRRAR